MLVQQSVNAIALGSTYALFAIGLSLGWGALDVLNMAYGATVVFAGFLSYELTRVADIGFLALVAVGIGGAGLLAVVLEIAVFRPIRNRFSADNKRQAELSMLAASVGAGVILDRIIANRTGDTVFPVHASFSIETYDVGPVTISNIQIFTIVAAIGVTACCDAWLRRSHQGRAIRAIAYNHRTAALLGVNVNRVAASTMFVSGGIAGLAGILLGVATTGLDVSVGHSYLLKGFAVIILGGVGSIWGGWAAAYVVAAAETLIVVYGSPSMQDAVAFAVILAILLLRPSGLFGGKRFQRA